MEKGTYNGRRVDFTQYAVSVFHPYLFTGDSRSRAGCGACSLSLLSGIDPIIIAEHNGNAHYSDKFMITFLRNHGFRTLKLTLCNLTQSAGVVGNTQVVLISQLFRRNEATWGVIYDQIFFHNFDHYALEALSFLNKPILSAYMVVHPSWRLDQIIAKQSLVGSADVKKNINWSALSKALKLLR